MRNTAIAEQKKKKKTRKLFPGKKKHYHQLFYSVELN